ncbi:UTP--GlnB (protein PII) uridylyltransferase, GlnD [Abditibacterium utsteinense]|uniref:Bifunctional uridylyltransferase/uridylyl-removing enzyme n=1 Tax=Abditibacterium utsteinense TaxID=1960156 RepID=A0A2S8SUA3_9BACT|nr:HD domain-containing protein [Abditibacterium utsteinense]PQV64387.1 UTP--GlnB (protein PII) uridylyltransferase, GlnD [Abditibacterium utsteinense]
MIPSPLVLELREFLAAGRAKLWKRQSWRAPIRPWLDEHSALLDETLVRITRAASETARAAHPEVSDTDPSLVLLAIGGYGRAELCPFSDIDLAFVPSEEENPLLDATIKEAFRLIVEVLLDGAKLDVGYAYRPISDIERLDHQSRAALLEARCIAGDEKLLEQVRAEVYRGWDAVDFTLEKATERRLRAEKIALSLYAVEPNLKDGTGALRDIHFALWSAGALLKAEKPLEELVSRGVVTVSDAEEVLKARDFFLKIRVWLHLQTGRKTDVLRLEYQDRAARAFSYTGAGGVASQNLLADYYVHAEKAARFCDLVLARLLEGPLPFGHFMASRQRLYAAHPYTLQNHPELLLTPFMLARKYGFTLDPHLDRSIDEARPKIDDAMRKHPTSRGAFMQLIGDLGNSAAALTELRSRGLLQTFIPEFQSMLRLAPPDPSHELTVGEHSIYAVRRLDELWQKRLSDDETYSLWGGVDDHEILVLATLLHDVGKIEPNTEHAVSGEKLGAKIGERLGLSSARIETLRLLIYRHLLMPRMARLRDISAPATIRRLVATARTVSNLKMLYLLSLADTCAVGEKSYSQFDLQQMRELYERALLAMTRAETAEVLSDTERREQLVQQERERMRRDLRHLELDEATLQRLSDTLPAAYVLNTPLPTMATHLKFLDQLPEEKLIVDFYPLQGREFAEMTVVTYDAASPGLLSKICGVVHAGGADIVAAHVYTLRGPDLNSKWMQGAPVYGRDVVLDRLQLVAGGRPLSTSQTARIAAQLREVLLGGQSVEEVLKASGKKVAQSVTPQKISARNDLSDEHTVITIVSDNVPGLLYQVTRAMASLGLDIHTAKVTTWGGQAEDAFYITKRTGDNDGRKLEDEEIRGTLDAIRRRLLKPNATESTKNEEAEKAIS